MTITAEQCEVHYYNMGDGHCTCQHQCDRCGTNYFGYRHSKDNCVDALFAQSAALRAENQRLTAELHEAKLQRNGYDSAHKVECAKVLELTAENQRLLIQNSQMHSLRHELKREIRKRRHYQHRGVALRKCGASVIKSGEPWTPTCEERFRALLRAEKGE